MTTIQKMEAAMRARRRELIARPLDSIYGELAIAALEVLREPSPAMRTAGYQYDWHCKTEPESVKGFTVMIDAVLAEARQ